MPVLSLRQTCRASLRAGGEALRTGAGLHLGGWGSCAAGWAFSTGCGNPRGRGSEGAEPWWRKMLLFGDSSTLGVAVPGPAPPPGGACVSMLRQLFPLTPSWPSDTMGEGGGACGPLGTDSWHWECPAAAAAQHFVAFLRNSDSSQSRQTPVPHWLRPGHRHPTTRESWCLTRSWGLKEKVTHPCKAGCVGRRWSP